MISYTLRSIYSALMLAAVAAVAVVTVLAVATALVVAIMAGGAWAIGAGIVVVGMLTAVVVGLFTARRRVPEPIVGVLVTSDEQPLLWVEVCRVAEGLGTRPPDELLLAPHAHVAASERRTWLGLRPGVRRLHLGLPLLGALTERQLRAVITYECCRRWGPVSFGRVIHRGTEVFGRVVDSLGEDSKAGRAVGRYGRIYVAVSGPVSRRHELEADRLSADLAGNGATSTALREFAVLGRGWDGFVKGYVEPAAAVGRRPSNVFAGFAGFLEEPDRREQLAQEAAAPAQRSVYDSQLTQDDHQAAIASLPEDNMHDRSGPAMDMLRDPDRVICQVEESMFPESGSVPATWEDIVPEVGRAAACEDAMQLARLAHEGGLGTTLSVVTLLELMSLGLAEEMVRPMLPAGASQEAERQAAGRLVTGFLATAAIESGTASYRFSWAAPRLLVDDQGVVDDLPQLVDTALADPQEVSALELWLQSHRVGQELELGTDLGQALREGLPDVQAENHSESPAESLPESVADSHVERSNERRSESPNQDALDDVGPILAPIPTAASI